MKNIFIFFILFTGALFCFGSCADGVAPIGDTLPKIDTIDCPPPEMIPNGGGAKNIPQFIYMGQRRSYDGSKIAYIISENKIAVADVKTGEIQVFNPYAMMPNGFRFNGCFGLSWCPYDNNKLALNCVTGFDTIIAGQGKSSFYGQNIFILSIKENILSRIDLPLTSFWGADGLIIYGWAKGSTPMIDSLFIGYYGTGNLVVGIIIPQEKKIVQLREVDNLTDPTSCVQLLYSPDRKHLAALDPNRGLYIDGVIVPLEYPFDLFYYGSWSPDGKKLAVTGIFFRGGGQVGVIDVEKWFRDQPSVLPVEKIDFAKRFCMYNLVEPADAEFLTNTTLAVSMHHDGDIVSPLWEITTDGRLLRQLTK